MFYGQIVSMYFMDNKRHKLPHIHVRYQDHEAVFSIPDGAGKNKLLQAWLEIHRNELMADWSLAAQCEPPLR